MAKDMGKGISSGAPISRTGEFYRQVQSGPGYTMDGKVKKTGGQSECVNDICDPTKGMGYYKQQTEMVNAKSPKAKVSKEVKKAHKLKGN